MLNQAEIQKIKELLLEEQKIEKIILFGSYARGSADQYSDVDLMVVTEELPDRAALMRKLRQKLLVLPYDFDVLAVTPDEFERDAQITGTIARYVAQDGKIIYANA
ncbi:MAG: nucleotidyltransferase domain-containing protein [Ignavibacteriaceae bacterium]|nr:nucleotidyltransferase domain-containing protein [Ignavibacteriaceae bacterium]